MRFVPKELRENVNISPRSPLKEFFLLLSGLLGIILLIYIGLGISLEFIIPHLPKEIEKNLEKLYFNRIQETQEEKFKEIKLQLQKILDNLVQKSELFKEPFKVYIIYSSEANAIALPANNIIVTTTLIKEFSSEDALAFVLAHELGHFANRDHLKGLGRGLVLLMFSATLFGIDSSVSDFLKNSLQNVEMKFSQKQEIKADLFGLELLNKTYGHVGGAVEFFEKLEKKEKIPKFLYFFASHPHSLNRLNIIKKEIARKGYLIKETTPLKKF